MTDPKLEAVREACAKVCDERSRPPGPNIERGEAMVCAAHIRALDLSAFTPADVLDYSGGGKISVPVTSIVNSPKVQRQVEAAREIQNAATAAPQSQPSLPQEDSSAQSARSLERRLQEALRDQRDAAQEALRHAVREIDSLKRRLREVLEIVKFERQRDVWSRNDALNKMAALKNERDTALREVEETKTDALRYRWLQSNPGCGNESVSTAEGCYLQLSPRDMDAAIDAALAEKGKPS